MPQQSQRNSSPSRALPPATFTKALERRRAAGTVLKIQRRSCSRTRRKFRWLFERPWAATRKRRFLLTRSQSTKDRFASLPSFQFISHAGDLYLPVVLVIDATRVTSVTGRGFFGTREFIALQTYHFPRRRVVSNTRVRSVPASCPKRETSSVIEIRELNGAIVDDTIPTVFRSLR